MIEAEGSFRRANNVSSWASRVPLITSTMAVRMTSISFCNQRKYAIIFRALVR